MHDIYNITDCNLLKLHDEQQKGEAINKIEMPVSSSKTSCKCPFVRQEKCEQGSLSGTTTTVSRKSLEFASNYTVVKRTSNQSQKTIFRIIDDIYEKCAAYNLSSPPATTFVVAAVYPSWNKRHCTFQGFVAKNRKYFSNFLKDLLLLVCFLIANSVVFLTILTRMFIQMSLVLFEFIKWVQRAVPTLKLLRTKNCVRIKAQLRRAPLVDSFAPHADVTKPRLPGRVAA